MPPNALERRTVIMYGPQNSGKSHHSADLARSLGCGFVLDDWIYSPGHAPRTLPPVTPGALHVVTSLPPQFDEPLPDDVLLISFDAAIAAALVLGHI